MLILYDFKCFVRLPLKSRASEFCMVFMVSSAADLKFRQTGQIRNIKVEYLSNIPFLPFNIPHCYQKTQNVSIIRYLEQQLLVLDAQACHTKTALLKMKSIFLGSWIENCFSLNLIRLTQAV
jgi:hypothetical protein